ncbi:hypothetical protein [Streptomyces sp. NPDC058629]|uniref:hypothetical protein n=1 Tax=Streptomyces sp. NPDC058629 TaxID=3346565 RepID=UPI0036523EB2
MDDERSRAQANAVHWADRAVLEYEESRHFEEMAQARTQTTLYADAIAHERGQAREHAVLSAEARQLAEMWACVARALAT